MAPAVEMAEDDAAVNVVVQRPSGAKIELGLKRASTDISSLKVELEAHWSVPAVCQAWVLGCTILSDTDTLDNCFEGKETPMFTLLVCLKDVLAALTSPCVQVMVSSIQAISQVAVKGDHDVILAVSSCLEHRSNAVRQAATTALTRIANKGDTFAIQAVIRVLQHGDAKVRLSAIEALKQVSSRGKREAIEALGMYVEDGDWAVRQSSMKALGEVAVRGDSNAIEIILPRLRHHQQDVRMSAVQALSKVAGKDDHEAITALIRVVDDEDWSVRRAAVNAVTQITKCGNRCAFPAMQHSLTMTAKPDRHPSWELLKGAVMSICM